MFVQNFIKLSAEVHELSCSQRLATMLKTSADSSKENNLQRKKNNILKVFVICSLCRRLMIAIYSSITVMPENYSYNFKFPSGLT